MKLSATLLSPGRPALFDRALLGRAIVYLASGSASALISFFLLPVLTRYLSPADYGVVEIFTTLSTCLTGILLVGGNTLLAKEYFDRDDKGRRTLLSHLLGLLLVATGIVALLASALQLVVPSAAAALGVHPTVLAAALIFSAATSLVTLFTTLLQAEKRAAAYAGFVNSKTVVEIALSLLLIIGGGLLWQGRILGMLTGAALYATLSFGLLLRRGARPAFTGCELRRLTALGLPLVAAHISVWAYGMVDRLMISHRFDLAATGLYGVGFRFASVVSMAESAFSLAWMPFFFESLRQRTPEMDTQIVRRSSAYIAGLLIFAVGFGLMSRWLLPVMVDSRFDEARRFIFLLCLAFWLSGAWKMFNGYLIAAGRTRLYGAITTATAVLHVGMTWWLLGQAGPLGAAWATLLTFAFATIATAFVAMRIHPMPWRAAFGRTRP